MKYFVPYLIVLLMPVLSFTQVRKNKPTFIPQDKACCNGYLFAYFTGNNKAEESIFFALSMDGYRYRALNDGQPVLSSSVISSSGGVRDPHILRGVDRRTFFMVATDMVSALGWNSNRALVLLKSPDLIHWTSSSINIQRRFPGNDSLLRVWAPQTIFDPVKQKYMIYFSMKHGKEPDKIYYAYANSDFTDLETVPEQLYFPADNAACIDGDIAEKDGKYYLFFKTEDRLPGIKVAVSDRLTGGFRLTGKSYVQQTSKPVEGAGTFRLNDGSGYILMYDMYTSGQYQFTKTRDMRHFKVIDKDISMNFHPRHGTVLPITAEEAERLAVKWMTYGDAITNMTDKRIKKGSITVNTAARTVSFSVAAGTDLVKYDPGFATFPGVRISPGTGDFTKGPVQYTVWINGKGSETFSVSVK